MNDKGALKQGTVAIIRPQMPELNPRVLYWTSQNLKNGVGTHFTYEGRQYDVSPVGNNNGVDWYLRSIVDKCSFKLVDITPDGLLATIRMFDIKRILDS